MPFEQHMRHNRCGRVSVDSACRPLTLADSTACDDLLRNQRAVLHIELAEASLTADVMPSSFIGEAQPTHSEQQQERDHHQLAKLVWVAAEEFNASYHTWEKYVFMVSKEVSESW